MEKEKNAYVNEVMCMSFSYLYKKKEKKIERKKRGVNS